MASIRPDARSGDHEPSLASETHRASRRDPQSVRIQRTVERGQFSEIRPEFWQTDTSVSRNPWVYVTNHDYKPVSDIIHDLVDIVSKNGALLFNIGPRADGTIPEPEIEMLLAFGRWLKVNGEAIYRTRCAPSPT